MRIMTYERSTLSEQRKVYWAGRSSSNDLGSGDGFQGKGSYGIHPGNESRNHSGVLCRTARNFGGNVRRRNLGGLALRSPQTTCYQVSGVQPAQERSAQTWQQE